MPSDNTEQRKLAAIMFTDMVGYSALSQRNDKLALELLEEHRALLRPLFARFNGTEVKTIGDAFLVEFHSALEAAQCGIEIQRSLAKRNHDVPNDRRVEIKIGIHIGDVVHRGGDVYGDGVNIASRIEPLAGAGGICVSMDVERQIRNALEARFEKLAPTELKNISVAMDLFRIVLPWEVQGSSRRESAHSGRGVRSTESGIGSQSRLTSAATKFGWVAALVLLAVGVGWWFVHQRGSSTAPTNAAPVATPNAVPGRIISLAVKPLDDYSGDTNNAYLSDGMTEALCAALGNVSALRVPGRSSVMRFKGGQKSIQEIARELKVEAIVEGSIQRAGNRIMITVQLVEAATDRHLWATNYQRDLSDFFTVQNEVARAIANEVQVRLTPEDQARLARARPANPDAVEACLLGMHYWWQFSTPGITNALRYFRRAVEIDPNYAPAYGGQALAFGVASARFGMRPSEWMSRSKAAAQKAVGLDPNQVEGLLALGMGQALTDWDFMEGEKNIKRALELSRGSTLIVDAYATFLVTRSRFDEALAMLDKALQSDPVSPNQHANVGWTYYQRGQPDHALPHLRKALELDPNFFLARVTLGLCNLFTKQPGAITELQKGVEVAPESAIARGFLGFAYGRMGQRAEAMKALADLQRIEEQQGYVNPITRALVHVGLDERSLALDWLDKAYEERVWEMTLLTVDPVWASLRNEPRFQAVVKKVESGGRDK